MGAAARRQPLAKTRKSGLSHFFDTLKAGHSPGLENLIVFQQVPDDPNVFVNVAAGVEIQVGTHIPGKLEQAGVVSQTAGVGGKIAVPTQVVQRIQGKYRWKAWERTPERLEVRICWVQPWVSMCIFFPEPSCWMTNSFRRRASRACKGAVPL